MSEQNANSRWEVDEGTCEMSLKITGEIDHDSIYEQWKGLMEAVGYTMENFDD